MICEDDSCLLGEKREDDEVGSKVERVKRRRVMKMRSAQIEIVD